MDKTADKNTIPKPRRRRRRSSYDESVDESAKLIDSEPVEVEQETPAEENQPVEQVERNRRREPPAFEE